jgi:hypothetical protein
MPVIEITTRIGCTNACNYCPQDKIMAAYTQRSSILYMSFDIFKKCIKSIPKDVIISFSGMCEPWLNTECNRMILHAHQNGYTIKIFTTLTGIVLSDIDVLESIPFLDFQVHLPFQEAKEKIKIDENYLNLLMRISRSKINNLGFRFHGEGIPFEIRSIIINKNKVLTRLPLSTRAGNVELKQMPAPKRKKKVIGCSRNFKHNVLLPNGDVLLCCMDYQMKHVLGNLLLSDYLSLFTGEEFLKVKQGLQCNSADILCNYCDAFSYNNILSPKTWYYFLCGYKKFRF